MRGYAHVRGQALPMVALLLWLVLGTALLVVALGQRAVERARAQAGADAVALSEAALPGSGRAIAVDNGVLVESMTGTGAVEVVARSGSSTAIARAEASRPMWEGLASSVRDALARAEAQLGIELIVVSGYRSPADQARLWASRDTSPYPVAPPGTSLHEQGLAVDVALNQAVRLAQIAHLSGLCQPLPLLDPVHFILCRTTPTR